MLIGAVLGASAAPLGAEYKELILEITGNGAVVFIVAVLGSSAAPLGAEYNELKLVITGNEALAVIGVALVGATTASPEAVYKEL